MFKRLFAALALLFPLTIGAATAAEKSKSVTLYKDPDCGCCQAYAEYLQGNGFTVTVQPTHELAQMSRKAGIPDDFQGCHLAFVDGYAVSGHVPLKIVDRLLRERPDVKGITLPGMPTGSPGMGGPKSAPFTVYSVGDGAPQVFAVD